MRASIRAGFVLILGATLAACGGGSSPTEPPTSLSTLGRLAIAQQELGYVSVEAELEIAAFLGMAASGDARRVAACFRPSVARPDHWFADLYALARLRLAALGVARVYGAEYCTHRDENQFFSYRRDGQTGRMASLILLR